MFLMVGTELHRKISYCPCNPSTAGLTKQAGKKSFQCKAKSTLRRGEAVQSAVGMLLTRWGEHCQKGADHHPPTGSRDGGADYIGNSCLPGRFSLAPQTIGKYVAFGNEANLLNGLYSFFTEWFILFFFFFLSLPFVLGESLRGQTAWQTR